MTKKPHRLDVGKAPCGSCPYRKDVPSGVWAAHEYDKLPAYDGSIGDQLFRGGRAAFYCHQQDGKLCAGWVGCHGPDNLLALRLNAAFVTKAVWQFVSPVPLFKSGAEACAHGKKAIMRPGRKARHMVGKLVKKLKPNTQETDNG